MNMSEYARFLQAHLNGLEGRKHDLEERRCPASAYPVGVYGVGWGGLSRDGLTVSLHDRSDGTSYVTARLWHARDLAIAVAANAGGSSGRRCLSRHLGRPGAPVPLTAARLGFGRAIRPEARYHVVPALLKRSHRRAYVSSFVQAPRSIVARRYCLSDILVLISVHSTVVSVSECGLPHSPQTVRRLPVPPRSQPGPSHSSNRRGRRHFGNNRWGSDRRSQRPGGWGDSPAANRSLRDPRIQLDVSAEITG